jgi:non-specific serine/threonine protein kinase
LTADILSPPGTDAQEALIAAMLQQLGRLLVLYHFPDEAAQIVKLMQSVPAADPDSKDGREAKEGKEVKETPGMTEEAAAGAVLGVDLEALGVAVARHWALDDGLIHAMRPFAADAIVRKPEDRESRLRAWASLANEAVAASQLPAAKQSRAYATIFQRYGRALDVTLDEIRAAMLDARRQVEHASAEANSEATDA